jgi:predicted enzyme related to lactoylglutathione lyase
MLSPTPAPRKKENAMFRGISTVTFFADDHAAAKAWYTELFGAAPYFDRPGYFEFRIGDYEHELGVIDGRYAPHHSPGPAGAVVFWHVDDLQGALDRLLALGATEHEKITERGPGFVTASVVDPFGNILGIMTNRHYLDMLRSVGESRPPAAPGATTLR